MEKETYRSSESGLIASVIYNRLCSKTYPCLNIDATIQYVLPERKEILTNADKAVISPYNTYTNAGPAHWPHLQSGHYLDPGGALSHGDLLLFLCLGPRRHQPQVL